MTKKLMRIDIDDKKREAMGLSGHRRCGFYKDLEDMINAEGRCATKKGGARVVAVMKEDGLDTEKTDYSVDTINRYLYGNYLTPTPYP